jgi:hypothetical protein
VEGSVAGDIQHNQLLPIRIYLGSQSGGVNREFDGAVGFLSSEWVRLRLFGE